MKKNPKSILLFNRLTKNLRKGSLYLLKIINLSNKKKKIKCHKLNLNILFSRRLDLNMIHLHKSLLLEIQQPHSLQNTYNHLNILIYNYRNLIQKEQIIFKHLLNNLSNRVFIKSHHLPKNYQIVHPKLIQIMKMKNKIKKSIKRPIKKPIKKLIKKSIKKSLSTKSKVAHRKNWKSLVNLQR